MSTLGLTEQNIIFLGYGDGLLMELQNSPFPTTIYTSNAGQTQTYASRGLGGTDYHNYLNHVHGAYNQATVLSDVEAVLQNFKPDEIYTTASWDAHPDHQATGLFVAEAILALRKGGLSFSPKLYLTIIHAPSDGYMSAGPNFWPWPPFTPLVPLPIPHGLSATSLDWNQIINFPVPAVMEDTNPSTNLKEQALNAYQSQMAATHNWLFAFVKKNEFFWLYNYSTNLALTATVADSSEASGQPGTAAANGIVDGYPNNFSQEWASVGQLAGAWIQLNWSQPITTSLIVLHDRPNTTDNIRAGTLSFSDGSSINVGTLPDNGDGLPVSFSPKTITSVKFTVNQAVGLNIGLSEIEVYGTLANSSTNFGPQISYGPLASLGIVNSTDSSNLSVTAFDVNGNTLQYSWSADSGTIQGNGSTATFFPPASSSNPVLTITATVSDGKGPSMSNTAFISANIPSTLTLNPATVLSGATSQGTVTLLGPAPASGAVVTLLSRNTSLATVPPSVTVPGGATSASFTVNTASVATSMQTSISASYEGQSQSATLTVNPIVPTLSLAPNTVFGGASSQGTVTLAAPAPANGVVVSLSSNKSVATVPSSLTVAGGSTSKTFTVNTSSVSVVTSATISAAVGTNTSSATLTVDPQSTTRADVALLATVTASSENAAQGQQGIKAIDGIIDGYPGDYTKEWATLGQLAGAWIQLSWSSPVQVNEIVLYDRPNLSDNVLAGTLTFSDGTSLPVGQLQNDASSGYAATFAAKTITWVKFTVTNAVGYNIGLAEFQVIGTGSDIALGATVMDSSENASTGQLGIKAIDGVVDGYPGDFTKEWATLGQLAGAWIQLNWSSPVQVNEVILYDRPNLPDNVQSGALLFSDGTSYPVQQLANDASSGYAITFPTKTVSWVKFTVTNAVGFNIGLAEFQVIAGP
jgi:LmbE family N-acetylglucosaminyl deacetylase